MTAPVPAVPDAPEVEQVERCARAALDAFHKPKHPLYDYDSTSEGYREAWREVVRAVLAAASVTPPQTRVESEPYVWVVAAPFEHGTAPTLYRWDNEEQARTHAEQLAQIRTRPPLWVRYRRELDPPWVEVVDEEKP